jgi:hypothetical protein
MATSDWQKSWSNTVTFSATDDQLNDPLSFNNPSGAKLAFLETNNWKNSSFDGSGGPGSTITARRSKDNRKFTATLSSDGNTLSITLYEPGSGGAESGTWTAGGGSGGGSGPEPGERREGDDQHHRSAREERLQPQ